jgi:uncharacterized protein
MPLEPDFLGTGWAFPPSFAAGGADVEMVSGAEDIRQSIEIQLSTHPAERPFQDGFGCDLRQFLHAEIDSELTNDIRQAVSHSLLMHEPRIALHEVEVEVGNTEASSVNIRADYTIRGTNSRFNLVYPFYLQESVQPPT